MRLILISFLQILFSNIYAQFQVNWNTVNTDYAYQNPLRKVWIDDEGNSLILCSDEQTHFYLSKIDNAGNIYDTDYYYFSDTLILSEQLGYLRDESNNIYTWGSAEIGFLDFKDVIVKFDENLNLLWVYYYPDTVGLRAGSVFVSNDTMSVLTRAANTFQLWIQDINSNLLSMHSEPHGYFEGSFGWTAKNEDKIYLSIENDSLIFMIFDNQSNFLYRKVHFLTDTISAFGGFKNKHYFDGEGNLYYISNRYNYAGLENRHVFKFTPEGDLLWEITRTFPSELTSFILSEIVQTNDGFMVYDLFRNTSGENIVYINNYSTEGVDFGDITINLNEYFIPDYGATALFDHAFGKLYFYIPEIQDMEENAGLASFDIYGDFIFADTLEVAYCNSTGQGALHNAPGNNLIITNAKTKIGFITDNIEVTQLSDLSTGIAENKPGEKLQIHPNPVNDQLNIECNDINYSGKISCQIISASGTICKSFQLSDIENGAELNVNDLHSGYYLIKLVGENSVYTGSFIKL